MPALLEKFPDLQFFLRCFFDPIVDVVGSLKRRHIVVSIFLERLESDSAVPFLSPHRQKVFRRIRHQRDVVEKKYVGVAPKSGLIRQRRHHFPELFAKTFQRVRCTISCAV